MPNQNLFLSQSIEAIELHGRYNIADPSNEHTKEHKNVSTLFKWFKQPAQKEEAYKRIEVSFRDVHDEEYKNIVFKKSFVVEYQEEASNKTGTIEFYALIRSFDEVEDAVRARVVSDVGDGALAPLVANSRGNNAAVLFTGGRSNEPYHVDGGGSTFWVEERHLAGAREDAERIINQDRLHVVDRDNRPLREQIPALGGGVMQQPRNHLERNTVVTIHTPVERRTLNRESVRDASGEMGDVLVADGVGVELVRVEGWRAGNILGYDAMDRVALAQEILSRSSIVLNNSPASPPQIDNGLDPLSNIRQTANGDKARTRPYFERSPGSPNLINGTPAPDVFLSEHLLRAILVLDDNFPGILM